MIAKVLVTALVLQVGAWDWIDCAAWDGSKHCYLTAVHATASAGTVPSVRALGSYGASVVSYHVCDQNNEVYKQVYLAPTHWTPIGMDEPQRYQDVNIDALPFDGLTNCFQVANVPNSPLLSVCWNQLGSGVTAAGGVANNAAGTLDECKQGCLDNTSCVAISYDDDVPICYEYDATTDLTSTTASAATDTLYKRLRCATLPSALMPDSNGWQAQSYK